MKNNVKPKTVKRKSATASKAKATPQTLPLSKIYPNPDQPRKIFEEQALHELAASIRQHGVMQPLVVRPDGEGKYMIVAGERRYRASTIANLKTVPVIIRELTDAQLSYQAIIENLQREDITPLEEARAFKNALETHGLEVHQLAAQLGILQPHRITERLTLLNLKPEYQDLLAGEHLTPSQAYYLGTVPLNHQDTFFRMIRDGKCDSSLLASTARAFIEAEKQSDMFASEDSLSAEEVQVIRSYEQDIDALFRIVSKSFDKEGNIAILQKIDPNRAATVAEKLKVIRRSLEMVEKKLREPAAQQQVLTQLRAVG